MPSSAIPTCAPTPSTSTASLRCRDAPAFRRSDRDWRRGERWFARQLNDYDLAANHGNWQWAASTGCDAQPYFRIFNQAWRRTLRRYEAARKKNGA